MKIIATSDLHGTLPEIEPCDLLLIGGGVGPDYIQQRMSSTVKTDKGEPRQANWLRDVLSPWLESVPADCIIGIAGNHDFVFEQPFLVPTLPWVYLQDGGHTYNGVHVWGTPWVPNLPFWAFHANEDRLKLVYDLVPDGTDILLTHGPPYGYCDFTVSMYGSQSVGSEACNDAINRVVPPAIVCGHIHEGYGMKVHTSGAYVYNVAHNNEDYEPINPPVEIML